MQRSLPHGKLTAKQPEYKEAAPPEHDHRPLGGFQ